MLRLISFNMDYYWSCKNLEILEITQKPTEKLRVTVPHGDEHFSALNYVAYVLYPPLYIAGPIMTFNDFMWQVSFSSHAMDLKPTPEFSIGDRWV